MDLALRNFALRNFRIANLELALRNGLLRNSHCEFGLRLISNFRNAKFRKGQFSQSYSVLGILDFAMRNWFANSLRNFRIAKLARLLRSAQCPAATVPLLQHPAACILSSTASHFLHFALVFPLIYGLFDG